MTFFSIFAILYMKGGDIMDALYIGQKTFEKDNRKSIALTFAFDSGNGMNTGVLWINSGSPVFAYLLNNHLKAGQKIIIDLGLDYKLRPIVRSLQV